MLNKFKNSCFIFIALIFSLSIVHANENAKKNTNQFFKFYSHTKDKKSKKGKIFAPKKKKAYSSLKKSNFKIKPCEKPMDMCQPPIDCDIDFINAEIERVVWSSDYGRKMIQSTQNLLDNLKSMYFESIKDVGREINFNLSDMFFPDMDIDVNLDLITIIEDLEQLLLAKNYISTNDLMAAERVVDDIKTTVFRNQLLQEIFCEYIIKNQILDAEKMFYMMSFDLDDDDELDCFADLTDDLIRAYMKNNDFDKAEKLAFTIPDEDYRDDSFCLIIKYLSRMGDIKRAKQILKNIHSDFYYKRKASYFIVDYFARQNDIAEFQRFVFFNNDAEFINGAKFILDIYQNNFEEAMNIMPNDYENSLYNIVEIFTSLNKIREAEDLIDYFGDEWMKEDLYLFFINAYLKNGQIEEAKRLKDEIEDVYDLILASKLIAIHQNS